MTLQTQIQDNVGRIVMKGRFEFKVHKKFKEAYSGLFDNEAVRVIEIEMSKLYYLDSSALGMLMLLNERAKSANKTISLVNPSGLVEQVLEVANFNRLFNITKNICH
jgi:anti-anti-sigma factor